MLVVDIGHEGLPHAVAIPRADLDVISREFDLPRGLVILSGPTFSGKNTLAYALVRRAASRGLAVSTIESFARCPLDGVSQFVDPTYQGLEPELDALRRIVWEPSLDALYIREVVSAEAWSTVIDAAMKRRTKFLTTIHTLDAPSVILRFRAMELEGWKIFGALRLVYAQRQLRRLCPRCREETRAPTGLFEAANLVRPDVVFRAGGCLACEGSGYRGTVLAGELVVVDDALREALTHGGTKADVYERAWSSGWRPLRRSALMLVASGETTAEETVLKTMAPVTRGPDQRAARLRV